MGKTFRWGIAGPGNIARKFAAAVAAVPDAVVVAVGSRSQERAEAFAGEFDVARAHGSYEALFEDSQVDAIYIATPHSEHEAGAVAALRAGKAVLCEKPLAPNAAQARRIVETARRENRFMMEAMWTRFLPAIRTVRDWIRAGRIGEVLRLESDFSFRGEWNPKGRLLNPQLAGGGLLDVGIYPIAMAYWVFGERPERMQSVAHIGESAVDEQAAILFQYRSGAVAILSCGVRVQGRIDARIVGTEGSIIIPTPFFRAEKAILIAGGKEETFEQPHRVNGYEFEAEEVARRVAEGAIESPDISHQESLAMAETMDALRAQWKLSYPFEGK